MDATLAHMDATPAHMGKIYLLIGLERDRGAHGRGLGARGLGARFSGIGFVCACVCFINSLSYSDRKER